MADNDREKFSFPCPVGEQMRLYGGGSGVGGQTITVCVVCGTASANTALRSHGMVDGRDLYRRLRQLEDLESFWPGADWVGMLLAKERADG